MSWHLEDRLASWDALFLKAWGQAGCLLLEDSLAAVPGIIKLTCSFTCVWQLGLNAHRPVAKRTQIAIFIATPNVFWGRPILALSGVVIV
jgi:hypothetical protein